MPKSKFTPAQAEELAAAFNSAGVDYLFIGKSGAILLGYPETTQDVDIFLPRSRENAERVLVALRALGFQLDIIASKLATGREKDKADVPRLEQFRSEYNRRRA